jgi:hypothetical protein
VAVKVAGLVAFVVLVLALMWLVARVPIGEP